MKRFRLTAFAMVCCFICFFAVPAFAQEPAPTYSYDSQAAIAYAKKHWNDGWGLCIYFSINCVRAGGLNLPHGGGTFKGFLRDVDKLQSGAMHMLTTEDADQNGIPDGYSVLRNEENEHIAMEGDLLLWHCAKCKDYVHVGVLGKDRSGYLSIYAHNLAENNQKPFKASCYVHGEGTFMEAHAYHFFRVDEQPEAALPAAP